MGDSEDFEAGHIKTRDVYRIVSPVVFNTTEGLNGKICQGRNRRDGMKNVEFKTEVFPFRCALKCQSGDIGKWR